MTRGPARLWRPHRLLAAGAGLTIVACAAALKGVLSDGDAFVPLEALMALTVAGVVVVPALCRPLRFSLWMWCIVGVFVLGYVGKSLAFSIWLEPLAAHFPELAWLRMDDVARGLIVIGAAFLSFAVVSLAITVMDRGVGLVVPAAGPGVSPRRLTGLIAGAVVVSVATSILPLLFGFGAMGVEARPLPLRLDIAVTRARINLVPAALLLAVWAAEGRRLWRHQVLAVVGLALAAVLDGIVRGSRGSLILFLLPLFFMWLLQGRLSVRRVGLAVAVLLGYFALYPVFTIIRTARITSLSVSELVRLGSNAPGGRDGQAMGVLINAATRFSGAEAIWWLEGTHPDAVRPALAADMLKDGALTKSYTWNVVGLTTDSDWRPPTLVGAFLYVGGMSAVIGFTVLLTLVLEAANRYCGRGRAAPVGQAIFAAFVVVHVSEGNFGVREPAALVITLMFVAVLFRWLTGDGVMTPTNGEELQAAAIPLGGQQ